MDEWTKEDEADKTNGITLFEDGEEMDGRARLPS